MWMELTFLLVEHIGKVWLWIGADDDYASGSDFSNMIVHRTCEESHMWSDCEAALMPCYMECDRPPKSCVELMDFVTYGCAKDCPDCVFEDMASLMECSETEKSKEYFMTYDAVVAIAMKRPVLVYTFATVGIIGVL